jgi:hypothetical protein
MSLPLEPCARARRLTLLVATTGRGRNASFGCWATAMPEREAGEERKN